MGSSPLPKSTEVVRRGPLGRGLAGEYPPGPRAVPLVGTHHIFRRDQLRSMAGLVVEHGDVVSYCLGRSRIFLLAHPNDLHELLVAQQSKFMKGVLTHELATIVGRGLVTSEGSFWRRQRKIAAPSFTRRHIERFADAMVECTRDVLASIDSGPRNVHLDMMQLTLRVVLETVFGDADVPDTDRVGAIVEHLLEQFHDTYLSWRRILPSIIRHRVTQDILRARAELDEIFYDMIRRRRARESGYGDDLLGRLLAARDDDGSAMTDEQVRDEVATLFLAGHETTAIALSFAIHMLARHPAEHARVQQEVDHVLQRRHATLADVDELPRTRAVLDETMRVLPPVPAFGRQALEDVEISGWHIPRGSQLVMPVWSVHRDERWYENPMEFQPQRWLDGLHERLPHHTYAPFGGGPRVCIGNHFARLEGTLALATLLQFVEFHPLPNFELELLPSVTLRPKSGVHVRVHRRRTEFKVV